MSDFGIGANIDDKHYFGVNWERDLPVPTVADLRNVVAGDPSPDGKGTLEIKRGIEVGHIFQLGNKYSKAMKCEVLGENGKPITLDMGCYGIGVSRVVAAAIEQNNDEKGIIWVTPWRRSRWPWCRCAMKPSKYAKPPTNCTRNSPLPVLKCCSMIGTRKPARASSSPTWN